MTFLEHLEELRWRIIYSILGIVIGAIVCWIFIDFLVDVILLKPAKESGASLQNLKPFGQLFLYMQIAIIGGDNCKHSKYFLSILEVHCSCFKKTGTKIYLSYCSLFITLFFRSELHLHILQCFR